LLSITLTAAGCRFTTPDGRSLNLKEYDSIVVEEVELAPDIKEKSIGPLLKGYTEVAAIGSSKWGPAGDFDLEAFAQTVEQYATTEGTIEGKPLEPHTTREKFLKEHTEAYEEWKARSGESKGAKPVSLRIRVTEMRFPNNLEGVTIGTKPRMRCTVDVYANDVLLGSGDMEAIAGLPGIPLLPSAVVGRAAQAIVFDSMTRKTVLKLVAELGDETVVALERTK
jgi:hypothetical protein